MTRRYRKPHNYRKKKSIIRNRFFRLAILILSLLIFLFHLFFLSQIFQVEKIIITGEDKVSEEEIKFLIEGSLENKILFFSTKTILLVSSNDMRGEILNKFPQVAETEIKRAWPDTMNVLIIERRGLANFCRNDKCFLLDNEGIVFEETSPETNLRHSASSALILSDVEGLIKIVDKRSGEETVLGRKVIKAEDLTKILDIDSQMKTDFKIPIKEFIMDSEDKLVVSTQKGWQIYLNLQKDINWQITKLRAVLENKIPENRRKDLEYIELRFGNLVPFKYRAFAE